jgi:putative hemolysin
VFVPETLTGMELLEQFRTAAARIVFVVDEYGVVQGLMTPHDLLEAITGELQPAPPGGRLGHRARGRLLAARRPDARGRTEGPAGHPDLPEEDKGRYNTLAGLLMACRAGCPRRASASTCGDWRVRGGGPGRPPHRQGAGLVVT